MQLIFLQEHFFHLFFGSAFLPMIIKNWAQFFDVDASVSKLTVFTERLAIELPDAIGFLMFCCQQPFFLGLSLWYWFQKGFTKLHRLISLTHDIVRLTLADDRNKKKTEIVFCFRQRGTKLPLLYWQNRNKCYQHRTVVEHCCIQSNTSYVWKQKCLTVVWQCQMTLYDLFIMTYGLGNYLSNRWSFSKWYSFCFCEKGVSLDKTGGAVLSANGSDKTENWVTWVL